METYVIKYKNEKGHLLKKYVSANNRDEAYGKFRKRFGRDGYVYGVDILLNNQK